MDSGGTSSLSFTFYSSKQAQCSCLQVNILYVKLNIYTVTFTEFKHARNSVLYEGLEKKTPFVKNKKNADLTLQTFYMFITGSHVG